MKTKLFDKFKKEIKFYQAVLKDPRTPKLSKFFLGLAVGYTLNPIDLIPDFIPIIGHLDDLIIVPALVFIAVRLIPKKLIQEYRGILVDKKKVLFVCVHNSARSQMAEALLKNLAGDRFEVESAGLEPGKLNPVVVEVMKEIGIDISQNKTKSVFDFYKQGRQYDYVVTVCDESQSGACPVFPGKGDRLHWGFVDPSQFQGSLEDKLRQTRVVRDQIEAKVKDWLKAI